MSAVEGVSLVVHNLEYNTTSHAVVLRLLDPLNHLQEYHEKKAQGRLVPDGTNVRQGQSRIVVSFLCLYLYADR